MTQILDDRLKSFENSNAVLTTDNKIILAHASDADYNTSDCYSDYLADHVQRVGVSEMAKELHTTADKFVAMLLTREGNDDWSQQFVEDHYLKEIL